MSLTPATAAALILAGGQGTRLRSVLPDLPKPLAPTAGRPFLGWLLRFLHRQGFRQGVVAAGYRAEAILEYIRRESPELWPEGELTCTVETQPLGTAGGFLESANQCGLTPPLWLVLNGDSLTVTDYGALLKPLEDPSLDGVILGVSVADAARFGSLRVNQQGVLAEFAEKKAGAGVINSGVYLLRRELLSEFPSRSPLSFEYDVFPHLLDLGKRFYVHQISAPFLDIGTPETLAQATQFIEENAKDWL
ncbi:MAG: NTP transferase domain-containing protein [Cyanobacteria bacterium RI_101]|nr:NTP transferase domain-containing protein [Cyanobacteria bacterium RI_101]